MELFGSWIVRTTIINGIQFSESLISLLCFLVAQTVVEKEIKFETLYELEVV